MALSTGKRGAALDVPKIVLRGNAELDAAIADLMKQTSDPTLVKRALRPAAKFMRSKVRLEAPVDTGRLRDSVKVKAVRNRPILLIAVDRKLALRKSTSYPSGFPYVNWIVSDIGGRDKFVLRAYANHFAEMEALALEGVIEMIEESKLANLLTFARAA